MAFSVYTAAASGSLIIWILDLAPMPALSAAWSVVFLAASDQTAGQVSTKSTLVLAMKLSPYRRVKVSMVCRWI